MKITMNEILTEEEVIKALECCSNGCDCANCPNAKIPFRSCKGNLHSLALAVIKRQKEQLECSQSAV